MALGTLTEESVLLTESLEGAQSEAERKFAIKKRNLSGLDPDRAAFFPLALWWGDVFYFSR